MYNIKNEIRHRQLLFTLLLFLLVTVAYIVIPWHSGFIYSGSDVRFHINRIVELSKSGFDYPLVEFRTFNRIGYDVNSFYPVITLYPIVIVFKMLRNPLNAYYVSIGMFLFFTQLLSYVAGRAMKISKKNSIFLALIYTFSGYLMFVYWFAFELGEIISFIVIPLLVPAVISFFNCKIVDISFNKYRDVILLFCMVWITYSHLLTTLLCYLIVIPTLLINICKVKRFDRFMHYVYLGITYVLMTSFYWMNLINAFWHHDIKGPEKYLNTLNMQQFLINSVSNKLTTSNIDPNQSVGIGVILLMCLFYLVFNYHNLTKIEKIFLNMALGFVILSTNLFCWAFLKQHFYNITTIQFTFRLLIGVILFTSFATAMFIRLNGRTLILIILCILTFNITQVSSFVEMGKGQEEVLISPTKKKQLKYADFRVNKGEFSNLYNGFYGAQGGPTDYLTVKQKKSFNSIAQHELLLNNKHIKAKGKWLTNRVIYSFNLRKRTRNIDLPILMTTYNYDVKDNGVKVDINNGKRGTIKIDSLEKGKHSIDIKVYPSRVFYVSIFMTLLGVSGFAFWLFYDHSYFTRCSKINKADCKI